MYSLAALSRGHSQTTCKLGQLYVVGQPNANLVSRPYLVKVSWLVKKLQNGANLIYEKPPRVFMKTYLLKR